MYLKCSEYVQSAFRVRSECVQSVVESLNTLGILVVVESSSSAIQTYSSGIGMHLEYIWTALE